MSCHVSRITPLASLLLACSVSSPAEGPEDLNDLDLGDHASSACRAAMPRAAELLEAAAAGDPAAAAAAYSGDLQALVQAIDAALAREDDLALSAALAAATPADAARAEGILLSALAAHMRDRLAAVETGATDKYAAWDDAHCVWDGALRQLAARADAATWTNLDDGIEAAIDDALAAGHDAISGAPPATTVDDWRTPPARQRAEKSLFRAAHRVLVEEAGRRDAVASARALALFGILEDRLEGRNTPGIAAIEAMLAGDPAALDPDALRDELDLAFAKRTRKYCDEAFNEGLGVPASHTGAVEGRTYALLIAPGMAEAGLAVADYLADWDAYVELVRTGDDLAGAMRLSERLVAATCAYQQALGVAACTASADESAE